jgi:hypothetical protein
VVIGRWLPETNELVPQRRIIHHSRVDIGEDATTCGAVLSAESWFGTTVGARTIF